MAREQFGSRHTLWLCAGAPVLADGEGRLEYAPITDVPTSRGVGAV